MTKKLEGKIAVVTGGTEGSGLATAKLFVDEGAYVFITGRRHKELDEAVKAIGTNVSGVQGDVSKSAGLDRLYETISGVKGRLDIVFANAGVGEFVPFGAVTEEHFDKLFNINVRGTLFTVQRALPRLKDGGSIILNGSVASVKGTAAFGVYAASKAAIRSFVRTWTTDLKDRHIRSNVVSPGPINTPLVSRQSADAIGRTVSTIRWDAWENLTKLLRQRCSSLRMTPVSSRLSNFSLTAVELKSSRKSGRLRSLPDKVRTTNMHATELAQKLLSLILAEGAERQCSCRCRNSFVRLRASAAAAAL